MPASAVSQVALDPGTIHPYRRSGQPEMMLWCEHAVLSEQEASHGNYGHKDQGHSRTGLLPPRPIAGKWRNAARIGFGGFFLAMAAYNTTVTLPNTAESYKALADLSWPGFDWLGCTSSSRSGCRSPCC